MDNRVFNINGRTKEQLTLAVKCLLLDEYNKKENVKGWYVNSKKGLVLTWLVKEGYKAHAFTDRMSNPTPMEEDELVDTLWNWLHSKEAKTIECEGKDAQLEDSDVSTELGWRLYTEDWGHVHDGSSMDHYSIAAFKPCHLWYGK